MAAETGQPLRAATHDHSATSPAEHGPGNGVAESVVFTLDDPVAADVLRDAWQALLQQHAQPAANGNDEAVENAALEVLDWRDEADEHGRDVRLDRFLRTPGLAASGTAPMTLALIRWNDASWRCACGFQSGVLDSRSFGILLRELFARYYADLHGVDATSKGSRPVANVGNWLDITGGPRVDKAFWRAFLDSARLPFHLDLPPVGPADHGDDACIERRIDAARSDGIRRLGKAADVTMNNLAQAAWALTISRYSGNDDTVFGIVRSCRRSLPPGVDDALGAFVNILPLRLSINTEANVFELLWQARDQHRKLREHECAPLEEVAECVTGDARPLFDSTLEFDQRDPMRALEETFGVNGPRDFRHHKPASYPLELQVLGEREITVRLRHLSSAIDRDTAQRLLEHFCRMLDSMAREPWIAVKDLDYLRDEDKAACRWPGAQRLRSAGKARTVHGTFEDCVARNPDAIALGCAGQRITYGELNRRANRLAHRLRELGAKPDQLVGLCVGRSIEQVVGLLGILKAGAAYLPLDPDYPRERLGFMLDDANVQLVVTDETSATALPDGAFQRVALPGAGEEDDGNPENRAAGADLAYVIYTSGSTGRPKGVMVEHRNVLRLFDACESWLSPSIGDVWTQFHSIAFDFSVWEIWGALLHGGRLEIVPTDVARSPDAFHELLHAEGVTVLSQTPSAFRLLDRVDADSGKALPALRLVVFGGEKLDFNDLREWMARHGDERPRLVNMYGITETTVHVTYRPILRKDTEHPVAARIGLPLPDLYVRLLDREGRPVPPGVRGEICVGGAGVTRGYLNRPRLTGERFVADPLDPEARLYRSGDFARLMPDGELAYLGREDDQVKIRGFRIDLGEVAAALRDVPRIRHAIVIARGAAGEKRLVAYYVSRDGAIDVDELRAVLARRLPAHMLPAAFVHMDALPVNANNKIDVKALPDPASIASPASGDEPATDSERQLARIWATVLERTPPGRDADFFALGGDSILAVKVVAGARAAGLSLQPRDIFNHPRLADLARRMDDATGTARRSPEQGLSMQDWFFEQHFEHADHFNHARLFRVPPATDIEALEKAVLAVVERHPSLHRRFSSNEQGRWKSTAVLPEEALEFSRIELDHLDDDEQREAVALITADIQSSLSLSAGLLLRAAHFTGGHDEGDLLLIVVHRLAMDEASWKPFMEELDVACRAFAAGEPPVFPDNASPASAAAPGSGNIAADEAKLRLADSLQQAIANPGKEGNARTVAFSMNAADSLPLSRSRSGRARDRVLAALARAVSGTWPGGGSLPVDVLGRAGDESPQGVGPWSTLQPVTVALSGDGDIHAAPFASRRALILFDWLPAGDIASADTLFTPLPGEPAASIAPGNHMTHPMVVTARVHDGKLALSVRHDPGVIPPGDIDTLLENFRRALSDTAANGTAGVSPADFPFAALSREEIERFPVDMDSVDDIMVLSPIQRLHHALAGSGQDAGFDQWVFRLSGDIDTAAFDAAWQRLCRRHDMLRARFVDRGLREPHQVVMREVANGVRFMDWRDLDADARERELRAFLEADRAEGIRGDTAPPMRATLIRSGERDWVFAWSHHQAFVDGWCWPILASELGELHDAIVERREAKLPAAGSYRSYLTALRERDTADHAAFWRAHLHAGAHDQVETLIARAGPGKGVGNGAGKRELRRYDMPVRAGLGTRLERLARKLCVTPSLVFQAAWALLLAGVTQRFEVTLGMTFSGRTASANIPEHTIGSFVNDLPVHVKVPPAARIDRWLAGMRHLQADLGHYQNVSPQEVHRWAGVRPGARLFDSLLVVQNQAVGDAARRWGRRIRLRGYEAGMRTNYPLSVSVTLGADLAIRFFHDASMIDADNVRLLANDLHRILAAMADSPDIHVSTVINHANAKAAFNGSPRTAAISKDAAPPAGTAEPGERDPLERTIASVCETVLGSDGFQAERNFFDAGVQSLSLMEIHERLQKALDRQFPIVTLFQHPSVKALAQHLQGADEPDAEGIERGAQQRAALMRRRQARQPGNLER